MKTDRVGTPHQGYVRGWSLNEPFEGSVLPDGEIVPKYDLAMIKASGIDQNTSTVSKVTIRVHEESTDFSAYSFTRQLALFNDLALGAGKRNSFKDGDTWRVSIADNDARHTVAPSARCARILASANALGVKHRLIPTIFCVVYGSTQDSSLA